jgi:hypothetical protein
MEFFRYHDGQEVRLGDIVDVGGGNGPLARIVVIVPLSKAMPGFVAEEWAYLEQGIVLEDQQRFGLLHLPELDEECVLVQRT